MGEQTCADCRGVGYQLVGFTGTMPRFADSLCPTCDGTGAILRTGPYRLADGTWSDGIDRTHRINRDEFADANPDRVTVICQQGIGGRWLPESWIYRGDGWLLDGALTHAEAIAYADRMARGGA